jgi:hypothetical protein
MSRYFTLEQAQALLPEVERLLSQARTMHSRHRQAEGELRQLHMQVGMSGGMRLDPARLVALRSRREGAAEALKTAIESLAEMGVQVKDLDAGLVDFPTLYRGREVLLCWRLGEPGITFWHGLEEGFRGRKKIDRDFLDNHSGDKQH